VPVYSSPRGGSQSADVPHSVQAAARVDCRSTSPIAPSAPGTAAKRSCTSTR